MYKLDHWEPFEFDRIQSSLERLSKQSQLKKIQWNSLHIPSFENKIELVNPVRTKTKVLNLTTIKRAAERGTVTSHAPNVVLLIPTVATSALQ